MGRAVSIPWIPCPFKRWTLGLTSFAVFGRSALARSLRRLRGASANAVARDLVERSNHESGRAAVMWRRGDAVKRWPALVASQRQVSATFDFFTVRALSF